MEVVDVLEFSSKRKRMSVIVRENDTYTLYCKGADTVVEKLLRDDMDRDFVNETMNHLAEFADDGLRTLVVAKRHIDKATYLGWHERFAEACAHPENIHSHKNGEPSLIAEIMGEIEVGLELIGGTAIEDKLQRGVPEAMRRLGEGGVKLWVLTGDKMETATNIAYACNLVDDDMLANRTTFITGSEISEDGVRTPKTSLDVENNLRKARQELLLFSEERRPPWALVIDGEALDHIFDERAFAEDSARKLREALYQFASLCKAVIACRVSPKQKAQMVSLIRKNVPDVRTLAIGDGANDVPMIQAAHIGVGISGQEGLQAVNASDYALGQFRFLTRLLLVHGRWNYRRMSNLVLYSFYKNILLSFSPLLYSITGGFSAVTPLPTLLGVECFNLFYTSIPILIIGVLDRDVPATWAESYPRLYISGQMNEHFGVSIFLRWFCSAFLHASLIVIGTTSALTVGMDGTSASMWGVGAAIFLLLVIIANVKLAVEAMIWTWPLATTIIISIGSVFIGMYVTGVTPSLEEQPVGAPQTIFGMPSFYILAFILVALCMLIDGFIDACRRRFDTRFVHIVQEASTTLAAEDAEKHLRDCNEKLLTAEGKDTPSSNPTVKASVQDGKNRKPMRRLSGYAFSQNDAHARSHAAQFREATAMDLNDELGRTVAMFDVLSIESPFADVALGDKQCDVVNDSDVEVSECSSISWKEPLVQRFRKRAIACIIVRIVYAAAARMFNPAWFPSRFPIDVLEWTFCPSSKFRRVGTVDVSVSNVSEGILRAFTDWDRLERELLCHPEHPFGDLRRVQNVVDCNNHLRPSKSLVLAGFHEKKNTKSDSVRKSKVKEWLSELPLEESGAEDVPAANGRHCARDVPYPSGAAASDSESHESEGLSSGASSIWHDCLDGAFSQSRRDQEWEDSMEKDDAKYPVTLFFRNRWEDAEEVLLKFQSSSPTHAMSLALMKWFFSSMTFEEEDMDLARKHLTAAQDLAREHLKEVDAEISKQENTAWWPWSSKSFKEKRAQTAEDASETVAELRKRRLESLLVIADADLYGALLHFFRLSVSGYMSGAMSLRRSYNQYTAVETEMKAFKAEKGQDVRSLVGGMGYGVGVFKVFISMLPPTIMKLFSWLGFSGDRSRGMEMLEASLQSDSLYTPMAAIALLSFQSLWLIFRVVDGETDQFHRNGADAVFRIVDKQFPGSVFFMFFRGRVLRGCRNLRGALEAYESIQTDLSQLRDLVHYESGWLNLLLGEYEVAARSWKVLSEESNWSKPFYYYMLGVSLWRINDEKCIEAFAQVKQHVRKSGLRGKEIPIETFVRTRSLQFISAVQKSVPLGDCLAFPDLEIAYFWNVYMQFNSSELKRVETVLRSQQHGLSGAPSVAGNLLLGRILRARGQRTRAAALFQRAAESKRMISKQDDWIPAFALCEMGLMALEDGRNKDAGAFFARSRKISSGVFFEDRLAFWIKAAEEEMQKRQP
eukprot:g5255.t1